MKKIYLLTVWIVLLTFSITLSIAQPSYCLRLVQGTVTGTTVEVDIQIQFSTTSGLGSSNLQILYDNTRLTSPVLGANNVPGPFYATTTVTSPTVSKASFNIELLVPTFGITIATPTSWTSVGSIIFTYAGAAPTPLSWSYTGTTTETVVFDHDEATQIFATSTGTTCLQPITLFSVLPIELAVFEVEWANDNQQEALLSWSTATETNNDRFDVERSFDGETWRTIVQVAGAGTTTERQGYNFLDETVGIEIPGEFAYYRVNQIDLSGQTTYSEIRSLKKTFALEDIAVFPNPFTAGISIKIPNTHLAGAKATLSIEDVAGRIVYIQNLQQSATAQIIKLEGLQNLASGVYFVKIASGKGILNHKVIKQ